MDESAAVASPPANIETSVQRAATPTTAHHRLAGVEAGRGIAALLVVFYHTALHVEGNVGGSILWNLPVFGHAGVDFFFVLSGFIITFVHHQDIGRPGRLGHYIQRRFTRVLPFYWIVLAFYLADTWLFHPIKAPGRWDLISNFLLLPQGKLEIVGGAWTLVFELLFYTIFAVMVWSRKIGAIALVMWACLTVATFIDHQFFVSQVSRFFISFPYCFEFFLGMGAAHVLLRRRVAASGTLLLVGIGSFFAAGFAEARGFIDGFGLLARLIYGGSAVLIIIALVERERSDLLKVPRILAVLGRASYSVYLVHLVAIGIAFHFISRIIHLTPAAALPLWCVLCAIGVTAGVLASIWVEHPVIRFSRRLLSSGRTKAQFA